MQLRHHRSTPPRVVPLALLVIASLSSCGQANPKPSAFRDDPQATTAVWERIFEEREVDIAQGAEETPLLRLGKVLVDADGQLFIPDGKLKRVLRFDSLGQPLRAIHLATPSTKELVVGSVAIDSRSNLYVFDPSTRLVSEYAQPNYEFARRYQMDGMIGDFVVLADSTIIAYSPSNEAGAFTKFSSSGHRLVSVRAMPNKRLRIFHGRVQNGGIAQNVDGGLIGIEPSTFELLYMSDALKTRAIWRSATTDRWMPDALVMPKGLSAYDYQPPHKEWWDSFLHIGRPYSLGSGITLVTLFASHGLWETESFANIYRADGLVIAKGLRVPHDGRVVGSTSKRVYVARNAHLAAKGDTLQPLRLFEYRVRDSVVNNWKLRAAPGLVP